MELIGIYLVGSALLVVAGAAKSARPGDTARALALLLPFHTETTLVRGLVRAGAGAEVLVGLAALTIPAPTTAALVAASYLLFAGVVLEARRRGGPLASCGCFGRPDTPPTMVHLVLNLVFAGSAVAVSLSVASTRVSLVHLLAGQPWAGIPLLFACAVGVGLSALALSSLGALEGARLLVRSEQR